MLIFIKTTNLHKNSPKFTLKFQKKEQSGMPTNISQPHKTSVSHKPKSVFIRDICVP